jgi:hypothetical protein
VAPYLEGRPAPAEPEPRSVSVVERVRLSLPPVVVEFAEALERACEMSLCLA